MPDRLAVRLNFDVGLSHRIEAGADIYLMPSKFEPCGLNQLYSLKYGTVPLVHATGGLNDSVVDRVTEPERGTGYKFSPYRLEPFLGALSAALTDYRTPDVWAPLTNRCMQQDFSWDRSARAYRDLYAGVLSEVRERT